MSVSVIIPCYNGAAFLSETLKSALGQTMPPMEIIVIDDGSTDDSAAIAEAAGVQVRVIRQSNQGESVARNRGIDEAKGEWIAFLDADDLWLPHKLERQLAVADPDTIAVHTEIETFGTQSGVSEINLIDSETRYQPEYLALHNSFSTPSAVIVRRDVAPRFPSWTRRGEDLIFFLDLVQRGQIRLVSEPLTRYRKHAGGQTSNITGEIEVHQAILRWLGQPDNTLAQSQKEKIQSRWCDRLVDLAWSMKERRRWEEYYAFREHLKSISGNQRVDVLVANRLYPQFAYRVLDFLTGKHSKV